MVLNGLPADAERTGGSVDYRDKIDNIDAVCFFPKDFEKAKKFFEEVWEFKPKRIQPPVKETGFVTNFIEYQFKGATVAIWDRKEAGEIMGDIFGEDHNYMTAVELKDMKDVDELYEKFTERGVRFVCKPTTFSFGSRAAYCLDIEGNIWEFYAWTNGGEGPALVNE